MPHDAVNQRKQAVNADKRQGTALYASAGSRLMHFEVDADNAALHERATITLPADVQYAWPHASRRYLYVACSDGNPDSSGSTHWACTLRVDDSGELHAHGAPVALRWRPLHITTDIDSSHLLITYNVPSTVTVHRLHGDGRIGDVDACVGGLEDRRGVDAARVVRVKVNGNSHLVLERLHKLARGERTAKARHVLDREKMRAHLLQLAREAVHRFQALLGRPTGIGDRDDGIALEHTPGHAAEVLAAAKALS